MYFHSLFLIRKHIEEQLRKVEEMGVEMPKYYKAGAINPVSYAQQVQKRKLMWKKQGADESAAKEGDKSSSSAGVAASFNKWEATNFGSEEANSKFRRLMGIKNASKPEEMDIKDAPGKNSEKLMNDLERGYEQARQQTHRNRGIGLGFSSSEERFAAGMGSGQHPHSSLGAGPASHGINFVKKM